MVHDKCEILGHSLIQHGPCSNRIYLMKLDKRDLPGIVGQLDELAGREGYSKLFVKVPANAAHDFISSGFHQEAFIPRFYNGEEDVLFLGKYIDPARSRTANSEELARILTLAREKAESGPADYTLPPGLNLVSCGVAQAEEMSEVYKQVFPSYPFPIHDPEYLLQTMRTHIDYFGIIKDGRIVAVASSEIDLKGSNVEMTDFATLPEYRGQGLACCLLRAMEEAMAVRKILTAYTIARAVSPGMNITFARMGYKYSGTLINNTQISGRIESMNIWYKWLRVAGCK